VRLVPVTPSPEFRLGCLMRRLISLLAIVVVPLVGLAQPAAPPTPLDASRCAVKLALTLTGKSPSAQILASANPQLHVDALLGSADFIERFSRFINARFNDDPGETAGEDAPFYVARHVLTNQLPWRSLFIGQFRVDTVNNVTSVVNDANGLGYFRSTAWLKRYAGSEEDGIKLNTAYRMLHNVIGLGLTAAVQTPGLDLSAQGRRNAECTGCHYDSWFALDHLASVLTKRVGMGDTMRFEPPTAGPRMMLGATIANDKELVTALSGGVDFEYNVCRTAFYFVYGRKEMQCEGPQFDRCIDAFRAQRTMQGAIASLTKEAAFCASEGGQP
jgi:hypothetical protein